MVSQSACRKRFWSANQPGEKVEGFVSIQISQLGFRYSVTHCSLFNCYSRQSSVCSYTQKVFADADFVHIREPPHSDSELSYLPQPLSRCDRGSDSTSPTPNRSNCLQDRLTPSMYNLYTQPLIFFCMGPTRQKTGQHFAKIKNIAPCGMHCTWQSSVSSCLLSSGSCKDYAYHVRVATNFSINIFTIQTLNTLHRVYGTVSR